MDLAYHFQHRVLHPLGMFLVNGGKWLAFKNARRKEKRGRKPFRRENKEKVHRNKFDPLERFVPCLDGIEVPKNFKPHNGEDPTGNWQLEFLKSVGVEPHHRFLDIGCGDLRAGVPLIRYLNVGNYVGLDQSGIAIIQGTLSMTDENRAKSPVFYVGGDFGLEEIDGTFDFLWAHSVFTHVDLSMVGKCLASARTILNPGGSFLATFFLQETASHWIEPSLYRVASKTDEKYTYSYRNPYHHSLGVLRAIAAELGGVVDAIDTDNPKRQKVLRFQFDPTFSSDQPR